MSLHIRQLQAADSFDQLTQLIRAAYQQLADLGFRYWGTWQSVDDTRARCGRGSCFVATLDGEVVGTITLHSPEQCEEGHAWFNQPNVAVFHQFAIAPAHQKQGIGTALMDEVEARAAQLGATEIACDTAEGASHLVALYEKRGYRIVAMADWSETNYQSVILSKSLS